MGEHALRLPGLPSCPGCASVGVADHNASVQLLAAGPRGAFLGTEGAYAAPNQLRRRRARAPVSDWKVPVYDWKVPVFDWKVPVFGWTVPVFDWKVPVFGWTVLVFDWTAPAFDWVVPAFDWTVPACDWHHSQPAAAQSDCSAHATSEVPTEGFPPFSIERFPPLPIEGFPPSSRHARARRRNRPPHASSAVPASLTWWDERVSGR